MTKGLLRRNSAWMSSYIAFALHAVTFQHGGVALLGQFGNVPGIAPGQRFALGVVAVVGVAREGVGVVCGSQ